MWAKEYTETSEQLMTAQLALGYIQAHWVLVGEGDKDETGKVEFDLGMGNGF